MRTITQVGQLRAIGYGRVSRKNGRAGDTYHSVDIQRETATRQAQEEGAQLVEWIVDEDKSGGTYDRPGLRRALELIEAGEAELLILPRFNRVARSVMIQADARRRVKAAGARLVVADLPPDFEDSADGRMIANIQASIAEAELDRHREQWATVTDRALERGVMPGVPCFGYDRGPDGRFTPNAQAELVRAIFRLRGVGGSLRECVKLAKDSGVRKTLGGVRSMLRNRKYLGELSYGGVRKTGTHEAIVTQEEFDAAQPKTSGRSNARRLNKGGRSLLAGIATCASCGGPMFRSQTKGSNGQQIGLYRCRNRINHECPAPSSITESILDAYVTESFWRETETIGADQWVMERRGAEDAITKARQAVKDAEAERDAYMAATIGFDAAAIAAGYGPRQAAVEDAKAMLAELEAADNVAVTRVTVRELWGTLTAPELRLLLSEVIAQVRVRRAPRGAAVEDRVEIIWR